MVLEGHLGVDDDAAVFGQADDGVGLEAAVGGGGADLEVVVAAFLEAGSFEDAREDEFAPVAGGFVVALQGLGEVVGLFADGAALLGEEFHLLLEGAALLDVGQMDLFDLLFEVGDLFAEGAEEGAEGFAVLGGEFGRLGVENLRGQDLELGGEFRAGVGEGIELGLEADGVGLGALELRGGAEGGDGVAEGQTQKQGNENVGGGHGKELAAPGAGKQVKVEISMSNIQSSGEQPGGVNARGARDANGTQAPDGKRGERACAKRRGVAGREGGFARRKKPTLQRMKPGPRPFLLPAPELPAPLTALCPNPILKPVEQFHDMHNTNLEVG